MGQIIAKAAEVFGSRTNERKRKSGSNTETLGKLTERRENCY
ncbi:hypothetical protein J2852_004864 [Azospirillum soli]|nr:hypothetical protein [Azospirillum soli]